ncbi:MAG TPA: ATP-binding protein [Myxococcota bacterium]|nr:ATP-binding protein [Myxococcota bacterium]HRY93085.1 ATP-binding protein [Myxococcota bacterium]HSA20090.1 ATP-binding protein [Myxococcota bacterium]
MPDPVNSLDDFLGNVLRGVNKIVGCNSTNLVVINERTQEVRVRVGVSAEQYAALGEVERALGETLRGLSVPLLRAADSLVYRSWREGAVLETGSLAEMVGGAFPAEVLAQFEPLIGPRRFLLAPAAGAHRHYGVLLFEKPGTTPFSRQQRELLMRYARRIGEIIENDMRGQLPLASSGSREAHLLLDAQGELEGFGPGPEPPLSGPALERLRAEARAFLAPGEASLARELVLEGGTRLQLQRFRCGVRTLALAELGQAAAADPAGLESHLLLLTLGVPAPALFLDPELNITSCNPACERLLARDARALAGRPIRELFGAPEEIVELLRRQASSPEGVSQQETVGLRRRDGSLMAARLESLLLADDHDRAVGFLVLLHEADSDERLAPDRLVQQERMATMGEMAAQLAHEVRNPLVAIGATLEGLGRESLPEEPRRLVAAALREIGRVDMILKKHLSPPRDLSSRPLRLGEVVQEVQRLLEGTRRMGGKRIRHEIDPGLVVLADFDALKHVLFNLLLNALEASPAGGEVVCRVELRERELSILVEDQGPGLAAPVEDCLRPFFTTKPNGTGLGLAVSHKMAQALGGLLRLRNRPAGGCLAELVLPRREGTIP